METNLNNFREASVKAEKVLKDLEAFEASHEKEAEELLEGQADVVCTLLTIETLKDPRLILVKSPVLDLVQTFLTLGYYLGRTHA